MQGSCASWALGSTPLKLQPPRPPPLQDGKEIMEALISNSATFSTKTAFSQDKYRRKKARKYCTYITLNRPTAASISQVRCGSLHVAAMSRPALELCS